ncbi:MAG: sigma-70 family RNA polymerase sigma factor [Planctomycetes bacterium]|nr:sigma-70 family RNA polymerase sigma factor [Planctomycetota bacterium]
MSDTASPSGAPDPGPLTTLHVHRAVRGDSQSLAWLVERLSPLLLAQASWRLGSTLRAHCEPADLVQEAWLVLLPRLSGLAPHDGRMTPVLLSFLTTTILNRVHNLLRRHARRLLHTPASDEGTSPSQVQDPRSGVIAAATRAEVACRVRSALELLEPADREIILMRGIEQQAPEEVAAQLSLSRGTLSKRYRRALAKLRERLPDSVFHELLEE